MRMWDLAVGLLTTNETPSTRSSFRAVAMWSISEYLMGRVLLTLKIAEPSTISAGNTSNLVFSSARLFLIALVIGSRHSLSLCIGFAWTIIFLWEPPVSTATLRLRSTVWTLDTTALGGGD